MSTPSMGRRALRRAVALASTGVVVAGVLGTAPAATATGQPGSAPAVAAGATATSYTAGHYIVMLRDPAASAYRGGRPGLGATRVAPGGHFDGHSAKVREYSQHLTGVQNHLAASVGATADRHFTVAANGFSATLSGKQATELASDSDVLLVSRDVARKLDSAQPADLLGLSGKHGVWSQHRGQKAAGDGVVVGDIDTGIWPESKSFAGNPLTDYPVGRWHLSRTGDDISMQKANGGAFHGVCQMSWTPEGGDPVAAQDWQSSDCNSKLVGARYYPAAFLNNVAPAHRSTDEYLSARDGDGHGTHTASTAVGDLDVPAKVGDVDFGKISGIAPAAKLAVYKVCFSDDNEATGDCYNSSIVDAIDDAVNDGVDVINMSIGGASDTVVDPVEFAFEGAAEAGVFVAVSAGNDGPTASTVEHDSPWLTTVAATTYTNFENTVVLGDGQKFKGASISKTALPQTRLVSATNAAAAGAAASDATLCGPNSLDPSKVNGAIVFCTRGTFDRVAKSAEVKRAGGVGMILGNPTPNSLDADFHSVPSIAVNETATPKVLDYINAAGAKAIAAFQLGDTTGGTATPVPQVAGFSSRGPGLASDSDILKPDVAAPGVSVLAAVAPPTNGGRSFDLYSGTSMAAPHITGLAAFMLGEHPDWTPMQVKSAMMTSATNAVNSDGSADEDPFAQGAGFVNPSRFFDPGWFITSDRTQCRGFITGQCFDTHTPALAAKDVNQPSMAQGQVTASTSFTRELVSSMKGTWTVGVHVPGFTSDAPSTVVSKRAGDVAELKVDFTRTDAPLGQFATGFVTLSGPTRVRIPVALRPVSVRAPAEVRGMGTTGSTSVDITAGFSGDLTVQPTGLAKADSITGTATPLQDAGSTADNVFKCVTITSGTKLARFDLDSIDNGADMDLYVYRSNAACARGPLVSESATSSGDESVSFDSPPAGKYLVRIDPFAPSEGATTSDYRFDYYDVDGSATAGDLTTDPKPVPVQSGVRASFDARWSGLDPDSRYLGWFVYPGALTPTYVYVDTSS